MGNPLQCDTVYRIPSVVDIGNSLRNYRSDTSYRISVGKIWENGEHLVYSEGSPFEGSPFHGESPPIFGSLSIIRYSTRWGIEGIICRRQYWGETFALEEGFDTLPTTVPWQRAFGEQGDPLPMAVHEQLMLVGRGNTLPTPSGERALGRIGGEYPSYNIGANVT